MKTKNYTHKRKGGHYRIQAIGKGSGTLNITGNDELVIYHNELGQYFVRPLAEFIEVMIEIKQNSKAEAAWEGNWPHSAEARSLQIMQNGNDGEPYKGGC